MTRAVEIGQASSSEIDVIMRIMDDAFDPRHGEAWTSDQCRATFLLPGYRWLVASVAGDAVGFLLSRTVASESEMMLLAVARQWRGTGIGRALVEHWLCQCKANGVDRTFLEVREGNSAIEFYRTLGFVEIGRRKAYYSGDDNARSDAITMTSQLD